MNHKMFCFQCEQTAGCAGCTGKAGVCGKTAEVADLQAQLPARSLVWHAPLMAIRWQRQIHGG